MAKFVNNKSSICPSVYTSIGTSSNPITIYPFEQLSNIMYDMYSDMLIEYLDISDNEYKYNNYSSTQNKITEYYILQSILDLYIYSRSININVSNWNDFINMYELDTIINKLNCDDIHYKEMVKVIDDCFNGIPYITNN